MRSAAAGHARQTRASTAGGRQPVRRRGFAAAALLPIIATALVCTATPVAAARGASRISLSLVEARQMRPLELAILLLGSAGGSIVEAVASSGHGPFGGPDGLSQVVLAQSGRPSLQPAICTAQTTIVTFKMPRRSTPMSRVKPNGGWSDNVFYVPAWSDGATPEACARQRVLIDWNADVVQRGYFSGWKDGTNPIELADLVAALDAFTAARKFVMQQRIKLTCEPDFAVPKDNLCRDAAATFANLRATDLVFVDLQPCHEDRAVRCIDVQFARDDLTRRYEERRVSVRIARQGTTVRSLTLSGMTISD